MSSERRSEMNRRKNVAQRRTTNGRACVHCHYRKVRCDVVDKGSPCSNCRVHGQPNCQVYQKSKTRSARARGAHVVSIAPKDPEVEEAAAAAAAAATTADTSAQDEEHEPGNLADLVYRQDLRDAELGQLGRMCFIGSDVSNFGYLVRQVAQPQRRDAFHFGSRQFARRHTAHELQRVPSEALARCAAPLERRLLRAYFDRVNPGWPIVDEEHFMAQYRGNDPKNPLMLPLLNAMLLVGVHVLRARGEEEEAGGGGGGGGGRRGGEELAQLQATFFRRAKTLIDCRFEQDRTMYVQVALLMTWYSDGHEEIVANAWHWIGFAIRIAIGHGMHRDATHSKMLPVHRRLWTRLWWILFQFDTAVSAAYGRPQILNLDESDVPELEPAHFQGVPNAQVDFAMQHAKLCAIFASAMRCRWALRSSTHDRVAASRRADDALAAFLVQLPPALKSSSSSSAVARRGLAAPWTATLHLTYNNFVLLLHRPAPVAGTDAVAAACADPALCAGATASMAAILEALCCCGNDDDGGGCGGDDALWLYGVHAAFTALIYVSNELAAPSPMVAARARGLFDTLMDALRRLARYWQFAENLLRLFRQKEASLLKDGMVAAAATAVGESRLISAAERFSLRPAPLLAQVPWEDATGVGGGHAVPQRFEDDDYSASRAAGETMQQQQQQQHDGGLHVDELMVEGYPDSFALELFLAGMDGSTQDCDVVGGLVAP